MVTLITAYLLYLLLCLSPLLASRLNLIHFSIPSRVLTCNSLWKEEGEEEGREGRIMSNPFSILDEAAKAQREVTVTMSHYWPEKGWGLKL